MNDRFKFRFFETYNNTMLDCKDYDFNEILEGGKPVMQCTGLKDKNGKLIYEGDIVKSSRGISRVDFDDTEACFGVSNFLSVSPFAVLLNQEWEVIGNIYENPELLEDTECQK